MTATAPTSNPSPSASAQSLRQRYSRLSPLRLGIYVLVSLGSHLLFLGLFRWAWQVQLATQPVGSPIGIDFVEVDLSDGSFAGQLPDESADESAEGELAGGKLSAAQLNELIAQGDLAPMDAIAEADTPEQSELGQSEAFSNGAASDTVATANDAPATSPPATAGETEPPRSWFPRPPFLPSPSDSSTADPNRNNAANPAAPGAGTVAETWPNGAGGETGAIADETSGAAAPPSNASPDQTSPSGTGAAAPGTGESQPSGGASSGASSGTSRPNPLPPNMSDQPVSPDQTVQPGETAPGSSGGSNPSTDAATGAPVAANPSGDGTPGNRPGGGSPSAGTNTTDGANAPSSPNGGENSNQSGGGISDSNGNPSETEASEISSRLGANLIVDEVQSQALNTQDVFTQLPRPLGDPLSNGGPSGGSGRCAAQLAQLTPDSYGQPVQLTLAVDVAGEVFSAVPMDANQVQTAVGQAIICLAQEWLFEPAQRVIEEGGVEKVENAGAVLFVTVTISLLE